MRQGKKEAEEVKINECKYTIFGSALIGLSFLLLCLAELNKYSFHAGDVNYYGLGSLILLIVGFTIVSIVEFVLSDSKQEKKQVIAS